MGAWIETLTGALTYLETPVAPYVGAWIETHKPEEWYDCEESHPTWVRGLKLNYWDVLELACRRTLRGCVD